MNEDDVVKWVELQPSPAEQQFEEWMRVHQEQQLQRWLDLLLTHRDLKPENDTAPRSAFAVQSGWGSRRSRR